MRPGLSCFLISSLLHFTLFSQPAVDIACEADVFYGLKGTAVHRLQINSGTVTDLGVIVPSLSPSLHSLAFGYDIIEGSTDRTFYSTSGTGFGPYQILRYTGTDWDVILSDSTIYHNAGGHGRFIYFQHIANNGAPNDQSIARLMPDGSLTTIFNDTTLRFTVSDISVDSLGNIYCFRGPSIGNTTELTVLDSLGQITQSFETDLDDLSTLYGSMLMNGTLYLGWGTTTGQFLPTQLSGNSATLGAPLFYEGDGSFKDLTNCHAQPMIHTTIQNAEMEIPINVQMDRAADRIDISNLPSGKHRISLFDIGGRFVTTGSTTGQMHTIDVSDLPSSVYQLVIQNGTKREVRKVMIWR